MTVEQVIEIHFKSYGITEWNKETNELKDKDGIVRGWYEGHSFDDNGLNINVKLNSAIHYVPVNILIDS